MDIMNNMTVSTSKLTFSLIAISALLLSGSAFTNQEAFALNAPEFAAYHINTTATHIQFDRAVNGTLAIHDWAISVTSVAVATSAGGNQASEFAISNVANSTSLGIGQTAPSVKDKALSNLPTGITGGLGFINGTDIVIIHAAIPSDATYFVNYTNNHLTTTAGASISGGFGAIHASETFGGSTGNGEGSSDAKILKIGSNSTAQDWIAPTMDSAEILTSDPSQIRITMSEPSGNINVTAAHFTLTTLGGGNDAIAAKLIATNESSVVFLKLQNPVTPLDVLTLSYNTASDGLIGNHWFTDATNSTKWNSASAVIDGEAYTGSTSSSGTANYVTGHGTNMLNFTGLSITNWIPIGFFGDVTTCYDCAAPTITKVEVSLDSSTPITITNDNPVHINAGLDDTVSVMVTVTDNLGADTIPFAGLYTNFGETPDNLYYSNNFDGLKQKSTSYYEWNVRNADVAFSNNADITWTDATAKINADRTQTFKYTMTINDSIESSQVWVDIADKVGNYAKLQLPITLEVSGAPSLTFASDDTQKVVSFFNESILLAIVSQWTTTSSDDASNVEQLSSVLGIESQLPTWTTELASWVADDKIDVADMIVAVEYVINL
jgi:hypothetical protein